MHPFLALIACLLPSDGQIVNPNDSARNESLMTKADELLELARPMSDNMQRHFKNSRATLSNGPLTTYPKVTFTHEIMPDHTVSVEPFDRLRCYCKIEYVPNAHTDGKFLIETIWLFRTALGVERDGRKFSASNQEQPQCGFSERNLCYGENRSVFVIVRATPKSGGTKTIAAYEFALPPAAERPMLPSGVENVRKREEAEQRRMDEMQQDIRMSEDYLAETQPHWVEKPTEVIQQKLGELTQALLTCKPIPSITSAIRLRSDGVLGYDIELVEPVTDDPRFLYEVYVLRKVGPHIWQERSRTLIVPTNGEMNLLHGATKGPEAFLVFVVVHPVIGKPQVVSAEYINVSTPSGRVNL